MKKLLIDIAIIFGIFILFLAVPFMFSIQQSVTVLEDPVMVKIISCWKENGDVFVSKWRKEITCTPPENPYYIYK